MVNLLAVFNEENFTSFEYKILHISFFNYQRAEVYITNILLTIHTTMKKR